MLSKTLSPTEITATVAITSFIIQQSLQILDPVINWGIKKLQPLFADTEAKDLKKSVLALLTFIGGMICVGLTGIRLLASLPLKNNCWVDFLLSALVVSSGTETANTVIKYLSYVKDARKLAAAGVPKPPTSVSPARETGKGESPSEKVTALLVDDGRSGGARTE